MASTQKIKCPQCQSQSFWDLNPYRPFCSERCRLIDLGNWASEKYVIKGQKQENQKQKEEYRDE